MSETRWIGRHRGGGYSRRAKTSAAARLIAASASATAVPVGAGLAAALAPDGAPATAAGSSGAAEAGGAPAAYGSGATDTPVQIGPRRAAGAAVLTIGAAAVCAAR